MTKPSVYQGRDFTKPDEIRAAIRASKSPRTRHVLRHSLRSLLARLEDIRREARS